MDSGKQYRAAFVATHPGLVETDVWRKVDPRDVSRIACDRSHMCGEQAQWATRNSPFDYVCDYHRAIFDKTGTFWKE